MSLLRDDTDGKGMDPSPVPQRQWQERRAAGFYYSTIPSRGEQALLYAELISFTCLNHLLIYYISNKIPILKCQ